MRLRKAGDGLRVDVTDRNLSPLSQKPLGQRQTNA